MTEENNEDDAVPSSLPPPSLLPENKWQPKKGDEHDVSTIQHCYCVHCGGSNATTVLLPMTIPSFREIVIMSLRCEDCNFCNSEVNFTGEIQEKGERITLCVTSAEDLNRQLIKSDSAILTVPSLDFEIPPSTQRGSISTIEGILRRAADNLEALQPERLRLGDVDNFHRCRGVISKLRVLAGDREEPDLDEEDEETANVDNERAGKDEPIKTFQPFDIVLDDPAGNSFIENTHAPSPDPQLTHEQYVRTPTQDMALGLQPSQEAVKAGTIDDADPAHKNVANVPAGSHQVEIDAEAISASTKSGHCEESLSDRGDESHEQVGPAVNLGRREVMKFPTTCPNCNRPAETDMCVTDIPHFKEIILMCLLCEQCGYRSNEIKGGGAIPKFGTKISLAVRHTDDLAREVLKSDSAGIEIPELELVLDEGGLGGVYTTVEGLLNKMHERLGIGNPFGSGDAATKQHLSNDGGEFSDPSPNHARYMAFLSNLKDMADGKRLPFTLVLSDPLSNSFVGPVPKDSVALSLQAEREGSTKCYDDYVDEGMDISEYERSHSENEMLGLNDIKTEAYAQDLAQDGKRYYGTDQMEDLPDRLRRLDPRGPDHPLNLNSPVKGDTTVVGSGSSRFAAPAMKQRGTAKTENNVPL